MNLRAEEYCPTRKTEMHERSTADIFVLTGKNISELPSSALPPQQLFNFRVITDHLRRFRSWLVSGTRN